ncbi:hypothetical protein HUG17_5180 [Dermatophagoides farinae]|uniref:Structural maintenance of chromosomes protein n=1 Tax=Dermatophagoides farinae TaxID=6954 RepID=A0A9D4NZQ0_DERFA|nr:hypothetical protein HUG17_5180 [Dermatophagoides farinae]
MDDEFSWCDYGPFYLIGVKIFNFKSYRGEHVIGPFTDLTVIIGPNGSGKSNLMDAISFVLLVRNEKLRLRNAASLTNDSYYQSDESSDYSYDDSNQKVYVELRFRSKQDSNLSVFFRRSIARNKSYLYYINDQNVAKNVYIDGLLKLGFNSNHKSFLIFQEKIDRFIQEDPKNFTKILEELSGSQVFKTEYEDLKTQYSRKENELNLLVQEKQKFYQSKKFVDFLNSETQKNNSLIKTINVLKIQQVLLDLYYVHMGLEKMQQVMQKNIKVAEETSRQLESLEEEKNTITHDVIKIKEERTELEKKIRENELSVLFQLKCEYQKAKDECARIETLIKNAQNSKNKLLLEQKMNENLMQTYQQEIEKLENGIREYRMQIENRKIDQEIIAEYKRLKNIFMIEITPYEHDHGDTDNKVRNLKQQQTLFQLKKDHLNSLLNSEKYEEKLNEIGKEIHKFTDKQHQLKKEKTKLQKNIEQIKTQINKFGREIEAYDKNIAKKYTCIKNREETSKKNRFLKYLMDNYPNVRGRLADLCIPANKKYQLPLSIIMKKYSNAIVVDSFKTVEMIFRNEKSQFIDSETFLALDIIKAPILNKNLRHLAIPNVSLVYDLIDFRKNPTIEKAIRFVVGNTLLCETREDAARVSYNLGDGQKHNVISIDGTMFNSNGRISFVKTGTVKTIWKDEEYSEELLERKSQQAAYLEILNKKDVIVQELNEIDAQLFDCNAHLEKQSKLKNEYQKKLKDIRLQINELNERLYQIDSALCEISDSIDRYDHHFNRIETKVFGQFLSRNNVPNVKQFEALYLNSYDDEYLADCENRLENLKGKIKTEQDKSINKEMDEWKKIIHENLRKLDKAQKTLNSVRKSLDKNEKSHDNLRKRSTELNEILTETTIQLQQFNKEINKARKMLESTNKSIVKSKFDLQSLTNKRHKIFERSFNESIAIPIQQDLYILEEIFGESHNLTIHDIYHRESQINVNFDKYPEIKVKTDNEYVEMKHKITNDILSKESEIQKLTLASESSLSSKKSELHRRIRSINNEINEISNELILLKEPFENVKQQRIATFNDFLQKVSKNLDKFYKELMQNESSQSYLIPENHEEPYLNGVLFNCIVPGKSFQPVTSLSGGEKIMAIFAFLFSLYFEKMPSFFIMDEIDASLDNANTRKLLTFLKSKTSYTQFILISLKPELFDKADSLIGVCKEKINVHSSTSKTYSLDIRQYDD